MSYRSELTTARFIESLGAKVHNSPPSIEKLSGMFQDFYLKADAQIALHIRALSTRQARAASPNPSVSSKSSVTTRDSLRSNNISRKNTSEGVPIANGEQQMLTPQEISDRRKARRLLDRKGTALKEAVERRACERVYGRIWRHKATLDDVRDEKLRSRTAALALVGITLKDLGIVFEPHDDSTTDASLQIEVDDWISKARDGLLRMNEAKYPLGKLQQLAAAHKCIVDLLTSLHQSSSSADEILPTLIYTLITSPTEGTNVISNLHFIQRFRAASKVDGEAAYCLTNLEAAITFLETVDLASLRADEALEGPPKPSSRSATPSEGRRADLETSSPSVTTYNSSPASTRPASAVLATPEPSLNSPTALKVPPKTTTSHHRRFSDLLHEPANAFGAASDAVRSTADQSLRTIGGTLDNSFKLLFGRLQEQKVANERADADKPITVPRTLDDARKLVEPIPETEDEDTRDMKTSTREKSGDGLLSVIAGRGSARDRSVDSLSSTTSGNRSLAPLDQKSTQKDPRSSPGVPPEAGLTGNAAVESMRSLGNSLNPLRGFGGLRAFGRSSSSNTPTLSNTPTGPLVSEKPSASSQTIKSSNKAEDVLPPGKVAPPIPKFLDAKSSADLKVGEIPDLLEDYKRLARALDQLGAL